MALGLTTQVTHGRKSYLLKKKKKQKKLFRDLRERGYYTEGLFGPIWVDFSFFFNIMIECEGSLRRAVLSIRDRQDQSLPSEPFKWWGWGIEPQTVTTECSPFKYWINDWVINKPVSRRARLGRVLPEEAEGGTPEEHVFNLGSTTVDGRPSQLGNPLQQGQEAWKCIFGGSWVVQNPGSLIHEPKKNNRSFLKEMCDLDLKRRVDIP